MKKAISLYNKKMIKWIIKYWYKKIIQVKLWMNLEKLLRVKKLLIQEISKYKHKI